MATLKQKIDGDFYIIKGFMVKDAKGRSFGVTGYEVLPRGQRLFHEAGFRDGDNIEHYLFYALLMDQMLTNKAIGRTTITLDNFPAEFMQKVRDQARDPDLVSCLKHERFLRCRDLLDFYLLCRELEPKVSPKAALERAAFLRLGAAYRAKTGGNLDPKPAPSSTPTTRPVSTPNRPPANSSGPAPREVSSDEVVISIAASDPTHPFTSFRFTKTLPGDKEFLPKLAHRLINQDPKKFLERFTTFLNYEYWFTNSIEVAPDGERHHIYDVTMRHPAPSPTADHLPHHPRA